MCCGICSALYMYFCGIRELFFFISILESSGLLPSYLVLCEVYIRGVQCCAFVFDSSTYALVIFSE